MSIYRKKEPRYGQREEGVELLVLVINAMLDFIVMIAR